MLRWFRSLRGVQMTKRALSVIVDDAHLGATQSIASQIRKEGFVVDRIIPSAGAIRAIGEESRAGALRGISGVLEVRPESSVSLPPMSEKIPQ